MLQNLNITISDTIELLYVTKALSSPQRLDILRALNTKSLNIKELAKITDQPISTTAHNVDILQRSGLIIADVQYGTQGQMKLCSRSCDSLNIRLYEDPEIKTTVMEKAVPIGSYTDYEVSAPCGIVTPSGNIGHDNETDDFFSPLRYEAGLLWFTSGYVEYRVSHKNFPKKLKALEISFEACSEAPYYRNDWKSDITLWLNGTELGTWTSPGDFGGRRGRLNPGWWSDALTQFGTLNIWRITDEGIFINGVFSAEVNLSRLDIPGKPYVSLRVGVKDNAAFKGGINLFGSSFGDYAQDIIIKAIW